MADYKCNSYRIPNLWITNMTVSLLDRPQLQDYRRSPVNNRLNNVTQTVRSTADNSNTHVCSTKSSHCPRIWTHLEYQTNILISSTDQNCLLSSDSLLQSAWLIEIQFSSSSMSRCFNWFPQGYSGPHCGRVSGAPLELLKNRKLEKTAAAIARIWFWV